MQRSSIRPSPVFLGILAVAVIGGVLLAIEPPLPFVLIDGEAFRAGDNQPLGTLGIVLLIVGGWALSLTLHEFGHAYVAYRGGDLGVADKGYLTLDVRRYTDPVLSLVLPLVFLALGGIPLPGGAVWINRWALRNRAVSSWVSLAGPLTNLAFGLVLTLSLLLIPGMPAGLLVGLSYLALLQILTFVLNILPVPGLDGYGAIEPYLSPQARELGAKARPWAPLVLFALIFAVPAVGRGLLDVAGVLYDAIGGNAELARVGSSAFRFWDN